MPRLKPLLSVLLSVTVACSAAGAALAADPYPNRPVRVIVPYPPGGSSDGVSRPFANALSKSLGQPFVVENKGGAAGSVGTESVVKSPPDGYTLLFTPMGPLTIVPHLRKTPYDPLKDLVAIGKLGNTLTLMAVHPSMEVTDLKGLIEKLKANPGKYYYGSAGLGSLQHLVWEVFKLKTGVDIVHVPYRGSAEAVNDLVAGRVQMMSEVVMLPFIRAGQLTLVASTNANRHPEFPDTPSVREVVPGFFVPSWFAALAPAGTPPEIIAKINEGIVAAAKTKEVQDLLLNLGFGVSYETPAEMQKTVADHHALFGDYIKQANVRLE